MEIHYDTSTDPNEYDYVLSSYSGGKDSTAQTLMVYSLLKDKSKMELWHQDIDGLVDATDPVTFMDWPVTRSYCQAVAKALKLPIYFQWKVGGFEREMLRKDCKTAPVKFEDADGCVHQVGGVRGKNNTRCKYPQVTGNLSQRWCSAYLKIDPCTMAITNQPRFLGKKVLVLTGERAEESPNRAKYKIFEPDRADTRNASRNVRLVDRWRPVHPWPEKKVWEIAEQHGIKSHPAYYLGWSRLSCQACIFGSDDQWATLHDINPTVVKKHIEYEKEFGLTIKKGHPLSDRIKRGRIYVNIDPKVVKMALSHTYTDVVKTSKWTLPGGAFGENIGPN